MRIYAKTKLIKTDLWLKLKTNNEKGDLLPYYYMSQFKQ